MVNTRDRIGETRMRTDWEETERSDDEFSEDDDMFWGEDSEEF